MLTLLRNFGKCGAVKGEGKKEEEMINGGKF